MAIERPSPPALRLAVALVVGVVSGLGSLPAPANAADGLSQVALPTEGSSNPTYFATNHRIAITQGGRLLTVHGYHATGVRLAWQDPGSSEWKNDTTGNVSDGVLLGGTGSGDWPSSIAVAADGSGQEHAWVVMSRPSWSRAEPLRLVRLSNLDAPEGPTVGSPTPVDGAPMGDAFADIGFETASGGSSRGVVVWVRRTGSDAWELVTKWFTDLSTDTPSFTTESVLLKSTTGRRQATLVPSARGIRVVARSTNGVLQIFGHDAGDPLGSWWTGKVGAPATGESKPSAVALSSGDVLAIAETNTHTNEVTVQRFSGDGESTDVQFRLTGYSQPSIGTDGHDAWIVMIRKRDGFVVSRQFSPTIGWSAEDVVEIGKEGGGHYAWPNVLRQVDGSLRFVVRGPAAGRTRSAVLAFQRPVTPGPTCTVVGDAGGNVLKGTDGDDIICGRGGNDVLIGLGGNDILVGGGGRDRVGYRGAPARVVVDLPGGDASGWGTDTLKGVEGAVGSAHRDRFLGDRRPNTFSGGGGADTMSGAGGRDVLRGSGGNDRLTGGPGYDLLNGGPGRDSCRPGPGGGRKSSCER